MSTPDDDILVLAGEYVLGLVDDAAVAHVRLDPRFLAALRDWEARLSPLAESLEPVEPPAQVWTALEAAIAPRVRKDMRFWRGFGVGAGVVALAAALLVALLPRAPAPLPAAVATLSTQAEGVFVATVSPAPRGMTLIVSPAGASVPAQKSVELWLLPPSGAPMPLGLLAAAHPVSMHMPVNSLAGLRLAISLEPPGGSPTGLPTGPVIATAAFTPI